MKKRLEDRIIELAFSDRSDAATEEVASNPEAAKRLQEYRRMRSALDHLRTVPEHQLSTERLRQALLHQGLKRRRVFPWQALGYASAACGLFVCAFLVSRDIQRSGINTKVATVDEKTAKSEFAMSDFTTSPSASAKHESTARTHVAVHHSRIRLHDAPTADLATNNARQPMVNLVDDLKPAVNPPALVDSAGTLDTQAPAPGKPAPNQPVQKRTAGMSNAMLLIQSKTDADSGLDTAQEVSASGDVSG